MNLQDSVAHFQTFSPQKKIKMKKIKEDVSFWLTATIVAILMVAAASCSSTKKSATLPEDELFITKKYVGDFVDYRITTDKFANPPIMWVKTTQDSIFGKIMVYSRKCEYQPGEKLYIKRVYYNMGISGYWVYQLENNDEKPIWYRISEFQHDKKVLVQTWF